MRKGFSWVGQSIVLGALLAGIFGVGEAIADPFPIDKVLDQLRNPRIGQPSNKLPILLPSEVPEELTYPNSFIMSDYRYSFTLNRKMNVRLSARLKDKVRYGRNTQRVALVNGIVGHYTNYGGNMGTTKQSVLEWEYEGIIYSIEQSTYRDKNLAIRLANSSIEGGIRNLEVRSIDRPFPVREILSEILKYGDGSTIRRSYPIQIPVLIPDDVPPHDDNKSILGSVSAASYEYWFRIGRGISFYAGNKGFKSAAPGDKARIVNLEGGFQGRYIYGGHSIDGRRVLEWQHGKTTYGIRLPKGIGTLDDAIRIANSAIRGGDRTRQQPVSNPSTSSNNTGESVVDNSIPNAEGEVVELPPEDNNQISTEVNTSASPEIQEEEIQIQGEAIANIPDASVPDGAIATTPVDTEKRDAIAAQPIEKDNKDSHSGVYNSATPGIQTENALCGIKMVTFLGDGPGLCSDKRQRSRILFEDATAVRQIDGSTKIKAKFFNVGYADATIEVYSQDGHLVDLKILDGYQPPTGFTEATVDVLKTPYYIFTSPYKMDDPRYGRPSKVEEITLPKGGYIKITKSSQIAQLYGIVGTLLDLFQAGGDLKSSYNPPSKVISKEVLLNFAKDAATKYTFSIYKSDPVLKAVSSQYDDLDLSKTLTILEDFRIYALKFEEDRQALKSDNQISNVFRDIGLSTLNEGIETGSDKLLPGLGKGIKYVRSSGQFLNVLMKSAELSVAEKVGDENTIFIRDTSN